MGGFGSSRGRFGWSLATLGPSGGGLESLSERVRVVGFPAGLSGRSWAALGAYVSGLGDS